MNSRTAILAIIASLSTLAACSDGNGGGSGDDDGPWSNNGAMTSEAFRAAIREVAGPDAESCGEVDERPAAAAVEAETCIAQAFGNGTAAYTILRDPSKFNPEEPDESVSWDATVTRERQITFYDFVLTPDPAGTEASNNGSAFAIPCPEPMLSGTIGASSSIRSAFFCESEDAGAIFLD